MVSGRRISVASGTHAPADKELKEAQQKEVEAAAHMKQLEQSLQTAEERSRRLQNSVAELDQELHQLRCGELLH